MADDVGSPPMANGQWVTKKELKRLMFIQIISLYYK
jgi:hypothetical protein